MAISALSPKPVHKINFRLATDDDVDLPWYDHTALSNVNMCPTWGIIRYVHGKTFEQRGRAMALEAGSAAHEAYAAVRMVQLGRYQGLRDHFDHHGPIMFGAQRWEQMLAYLDSNEDQRTQELNFVLEALYSCGFYDDPRDKRRTVTNIEEGLIAYFDKWNFNGQPIWIADKDDPTAPIGVEVGFELVVEIEFQDGDVRTFNLRGRIDGIHHPRKITDRINIHENKTASRLDESWVSSFHLSHQLTTYVIAAQLFTNLACDTAYVHGQAIPLPRTYDYGGIVREKYTRDETHFEYFANWVVHTTSLIDLYRDNPDEAPRYTHSCNRYFRPCSFVPYCAAPRDERVQMLAEEMVEDRWDPLESKAGD